MRFSATRQCASRAGPLPRSATRRRYAPTVGSEHVAIMPGMVNAHHHSNGVSSIQQGVQDQLLEFWLLSLSMGRGLAPRLTIAAMQFVPMSRDLVAPGDPGAALLGDMGEYAVEASDARRAADDPGVQADGHHLRRGLAFLP